MSPLEKLSYPIDVDIDVDMTQTATEHAVDSDFRPNPSIWIVTDMHSSVGHA